MRRLIMSRLIWIHIVCHFGLDLWLTFLFVTKWVCIHKHVRARVLLCACMHAHVHACVCSYVGACVCMRADGSTFVRACVYMYILISKVTSVRKSNNLPCVLFSKLNLLSWNHCVNMPVQFKPLQAPLYIAVLMSPRGLCLGHEWEEYRNFSSEKVRFKDYEIRSYFAWAC